MGHGQLSGILVPAAGSSDAINLFGRAWNGSIDHWPDLLRLVGSMKFGRSTASLLIAELHASSRQDAIARARHEYGRLVRSIYLCRYVANDELRRRVRRQLNNGESRHALRHLSPAQHDHINSYGTYDINVDAELRRQGRRPLRPHPA